jgi:hypothetical protein
LFCGGCWPISRRGPFGPVGAGEPVDIEQDTPAWWAEEVLIRCGEQVAGSGAQDTAQARQPVYG